mgnify:CR=1 FL=1
MDSTFLANTADNSMHWPVVMASVVLALACVVIHYETLSVIIRVFAKRRLHVRLALPLAVYVMLVAHLVEILLYAAGYTALLAWGSPGVGSLEGSYEPGLADTFYFSSAVYTTVGFGDITPEGPLRLLVGTEALVGLVLITWSASFSFIAMQWYWKAEGHVGAE